MIMLAKSMHQIAQIEFRNAKFPAPLQPPPGGQPHGTPSSVNKSLDLPPDVI